MTTKEVREAEARVPSRKAAARSSSAAGVDLTVLLNVIVLRQMVCVDVRGWEEKEKIEKRESRWSVRDFQDSRSRLQGGSSSSERQRGMASLNQT